MCRREIDKIISLGQTNSIVGGNNYFCNKILFLFFIATRP